MTGIFWEQPDLIFCFPELYSEALGAEVCQVFNQTYLYDVEVPLAMESYEKLRIEGYRIDWPNW